MLNTQQVRQKFLDFYAARGHRLIPSASLLPDNDPSTLFTSSGMQPLVPYLLGQPHPEGRRLANSQRCFRAHDLEEVGDSRHTTFFEMLGNWSLGDYFKEEQLGWVFAFLTEHLGLEPDRLHVSVFAGHGSIDCDEDSVRIWRQLGLGSRITAYGVDQNWWSRSGGPETMPVGEPGGPDSEIFYEFVDLPQHPNCHPNCDCGRFLEIGNSVFMEYQKQADGSLRKLPRHNVDFGGGLERLVAACQNQPDLFRIDSFAPLITHLERLGSLEYGGQRSVRVVADHLRSVAMLMADGARPSNKTQGSMVRRLIRKAMRHGRQLGLPAGFTAELANLTLDFYGREAPLELLVEEENKFTSLLSNGLREVDKHPRLSGAVAFRLFETYGFPLEMTQEIARERGQTVDVEDFARAENRHRDLSRTASSGMFFGGLADHSREVVNLHTATHLLHESLRRVLGPHVQQRGSNITGERLRFDFSHPEKLSAAEMGQVEELVRLQIARDLPVVRSEVSYAEAVAAGALAFFGERYPERVSVYSMGEFSREICAGPHARSTGQLGDFRLTRQESCGAGLRRLYATLKGP